MSILKGLASAAAATVIFATGALAADLPVRAPAPAPVFVSPVYNWQGFYVGGNVGYGFANGDVVGLRTFPGNVFVLPLQGSVDSSGIFGGLQAGYNMQFGSWVAGVEIDAQLSGMSASATGTLVSTKANVNWFGTLRGRLGYAIASNVLIYGTAGGALTDTSYKFTAPAPMLMNRSNTRAGWTAGGGMEYAVNNNWSVKAEYLYVHTGKHRVVNTAATFSTFETQSFHAVRLGVNYRFGGPAGAVVAKY